MINKVFILAFTVLVFGKVDPTFDKDQYNYHRYRPLRERYLSFPDGHELFQQHVITNGAVKVTGKVYDTSICDPWTFQWRGGETPWLIGFIREDPDNLLYWEDVLLMKTLHLISHDWHGIIKVGYVNILEDTDLIANTYGFVPGSSLTTDSKNHMYENQNPPLPSVILVQDDHVFHLQQGYNTYSEISKFVNGGYSNPNMRAKIELIKARFGYLRLLKNYLGIQIIQFYWNKFDVKHDFIEDYFVDQIGKYDKSIQEETNDARSFLNKIMNENTFLYISQQDFKVIQKIIWPFITMLPILRFFRCIFCCQSKKHKYVICCCWTIRKQAKKEKLPGDDSTDSESSEDQDSNLLLDWMLTSSPENKNGNNSGQGCNNQQSGQQVQQPQTPAIAPPPVAVSRPTNKRKLRQR